MSTLRLAAPIITRAGAALVTRVVGGVALGVVVGVAAFWIAESQGWLGHDAARWVALPFQAFAGAAALAYIGWILGKRRAAEVILIDSGLIRRLVREPDAEVEERGSGLVHWAWELARRLISGAMARLDPGGIPAERITQRVCAAIHDWGRIGLMIAAVALAVALALPAAVG